MDRGFSMDLDYDSLKVLAAVIRTGSFETAAKSLNVTQSAISQRIKQLEDKVGSVLVIRGRPCVASEDGLLLCQHIEQVTLMRHELAEKLNGGLGKTKGKVRIAVNNDSLATWFPEVVKLAADELNLLLEVVPDDQEFTEDRLRSGDALAIVTSSETQIPGCKIFSLGEMEYLAVATPFFAEEHFKGGASLKTISQAPSLRFDLKDSLPVQWLELAFGDTVELQSHYIPSYEGHLVCCRRAIGWAMMPFEAVAASIASGDLVELVPGIRVKTPLFWHTRSKSSDALQRLSEVVLRVARQTLNQSSETAP